LKYVVIGDVHSSFNELMNLLSKVEEDRIPIFVGDFFDRGTHTKELAQWLIAKKPLGVMGNHDFKLLRFLKGSNVKMTHGLNITVKALAELYNCTEIELRVKATDLMDYLQGLPNYMLLRVDYQDYAIVHGAMAPFFLEDKSVSKSTTEIGSDRLVKYYADKKSHIASTSLYGYTDGTKDVNGFPTRLPWAEKWDGIDCVVIHGHTPSNKGPQKSGMKENVINVDTACCFGFQLTGLLIPDFDFVSVPSLQTCKYNESI